MGASLTAVLVRPDEAYVAEVGDSRAYLLRSGRLRQITRDQSLVQWLVDVGALTPEEAKRSPQKNVILQAMGLASDVRVAIGRLLLRRDDRILICCDGLSNAIPDDELCELLAEGEPDEVCERLIARANERGGEDNLTAIVAHLGGEDLVPASATERVTITLEVLQEFADPPLAQGSDSGAPGEQRPPGTPSTKSIPAPRVSARPATEKAALSGPPPSSPPRKRRAWLAAMLWVLLVALAAAGAWFARRLRQGHW
jgi:hypothetical protein